MPRRIAFEVALCIVQVFLGWDSDTVLSLGVCSVIFMNDRRMMLNRLMLVLNTPWS